MLRYSAAFPWQISASEDLRTAAMVPKAAIKLLLDVGNVSPQPIPFGNAKIVVMLPTNEPT